MSLDLNIKKILEHLSQAALAGGVTSVVTMPNTKPVIDNVSMVDFIIRRGRDKSLKPKSFSMCSYLTRQWRAIRWSEFGLLKERGIIGFTDVNKTIQNTELMSRIMNYASDH